MEDRPMYCYMKNEEILVCPDCGATVAPSKNDVCRAIHQGPPPESYLDLILYDKYTGETVASVSACH